MHVVTDSKFGGAGKYLLEICEHIDKNKFKLRVVIPRGSILKTFLQDISSIDIVEIDGINTRSFSIEGTKNIYKEIKKFKPHIIHSHACLSARIGGRLSGNVKTIYTRHSMLGQMKGIKRLAKILISRFLSSKVIAISKAVEENLLAEGEKKENIFLVYNGVELPRVDESKVMEKYGYLKNGKIIISLVGRLEKVKGQDHLLKISKILLDLNSNFKVLLVGEGSQRKDLETYVNENKLPVVFLGHISEIYEIYHISDIIVNTSNSEALSFAAIEGFASKKPVVAFDIDGIKEVVTDSIDGYLVSYLDYQDFANKLVKLIEDEGLRKEFGENGYKKVLEKFAVEKMVRNIEKIYGGM